MKLKTQYDEEDDILNIWNMDAGPYDKSIHPYPIVIDLDIYGDLLGIEIHGITELIQEDHIGIKIEKLK